MIQPNFRDMVGMVFFWALACKDHFEFQAKHGKPPLYPDLVCPFSQLLSVAGMTLGFADSHWPTGVPGSKLHNDLFAMLRPIANQGGLNATVGDLKRIACVAEGILGGKQMEAKEAQGVVDSAGKIPNKVVGKKLSTTGGDARGRLIAALSLHHKYEAGGICFSCLNHDPIGNNELAKLAKVDKSTASLFFKNSFGGKGYSRYRQDCRLDRMPFTLARLRGELPPLAELELFKNAHKAGLEQGEAE